MLDLRQFGLEIQTVWFDATIKNRFFHDYRDGLKDSNRSILTSLARGAKFTKDPVPAVKLISDVQSQYKEGTDRVVEKNLNRFASISYPLIVATSNKNGKVAGYNRISGKFAAARYINFSLTDLGVYVFKYRKYFDTVKSTVGDIDKFTHIKTPLPLGLLIPQINIADGISVKVPNLKFSEVVDALVEHIRKNKQTTTEDLAKHITGFETGEDAIILSSNQALYDLIERGVSKCVSIYPVKFYEDMILIKELPYRMTGNAMKGQFNELHKKLPKDGGFESFRVKRVRNEMSEEALIVIDIAINRGFTMDDVKREVYAKTYLSENIVYENVCVDVDKENPLTIKSVRQILDYHVDLGLELKRLEIQDQIKRLEERKVEADFMEKLTRPVMAKIIGSTAAEPKRNRLIHTYATNVYAWMENKARNILFGDEQLDYGEIKPIIEKFGAELAEKVRKIQNELTLEENLKMTLDVEVPTGFTVEEINRIYQREFDILYKLDKRGEALATIQRFLREHEALHLKLKPENLRNELINELEDLSNKYRHLKSSKTFFAKKYQQREERKELKQKLTSHLNKMHGALPFNIVVDKNMVAYRTIDPLGKVANPKYLFEMTSEDHLIVINKEGNSYKIDANDIPFSGKSLGDPENIFHVMIGEYNRVLHLCVTNKGKVLLVNSNVLNFRDRNLEPSVDADEFVVHYERVPIELYNDKISVLLKTKTNEIKKKLITEFKVKDTFKGFWTLFNGPSRTDDVDSACLALTGMNTLDVWDGTMKTVAYKNDRSFKRNVSYGEKVYGINHGAVMVYDKIPYVGDTFIPNINQFFGDETKINVLSPIFNPEIAPFVPKISSPSEIQWCFIQTSRRRKAIKLDFVPDEHQIRYYVNKHSEKLDKLE